MKVLSTLEKTYSFQTTPTGDLNELNNLIQRHNHVFTEAGMRIRSENTKLRSNTSEEIQKSKEITRRRLWKITTFNYIWSYVSGEGFLSKLPFWIVQNNKSCFKAAADGEWH